MGTILDLPMLQPRQFKFKHNGEDVVWEFTPLTAEQVEAVRAAIPMPQPPIKPLFPGLAADKIVEKQRAGMLTSAPDETDPEYKTALQKWEDDVAMDMVRVSLGWEVSREQFIAEMRAKVPYGVLVSLIREVNASTFRLDAGIIEGFLENLVRQTATDANSSPATDA